MQALAIVGAFEEESDAAPGLGEILVVDAMNFVPTDSSAADAQVCRGSD